MLGNTFSALFTVSRQKEAPFEHGSVLDPYFKTQHALELPISLLQVSCGDKLGHGLNLPEGAEFHGIP